MSKSVDAAVRDRPLTSPASRDALVIGINLVLVLAIAWLMMQTGRYALEAPPSFDGAMNLNTARSFAQGHGYGFIYDVFFPFPAQTDGPFVLPSALLIWLGGVTPFTSQGVSLAYFFGAIALIFLLLRRLVASSTLALAGTLMVLLTHGIFQFGMNAYGEVPVLFWFFAGLLLLGSALDADEPSAWSLLAGGVTLALCFLTKAVALMLVAPTAIVFLIAWAARGYRRRSHLVWFVAGLIVPVLCWEAFRFAALGGPAAYVEWWALQLNQVSHQSGAYDSLETRAQPFALGAQHLRILSRLIGVPAPLIVCLLVLAACLTSALALQAWRRRRFGDAFGLTACLMVCVPYFAWWLFITPTAMAWLRRIIDGLVILQILFVVGVGGLLAMRWSGWRQGVVMALILMGLLVPEAFVVRNTASVFFRPPRALAADTDELALARKLQALPSDATIFGYRWWQAPVLSLFSGRTIMDYDRWDPADIDTLPRKYVVQDLWSIDFADPAYIQDILAAAKWRLLVDGPGGRLYELDKVLPYAPFTGADRASPALFASLPLKMPYVGARGIDPPDGGLVWARPNAALLLNRTTQSRLSLSIDVPKGLVPYETGEPLRLQVTVIGCTEVSVPLGQPGPRTIDVPLTCPPPGTTPGPLEIWLHANGHLPFVRQIDSNLDPPHAYILTAAQLL